MPIPKIETDRASAYFDDETKIAHITYNGVLDKDTSTTIYNWLADLVKEVGIDGIFGEIFDFRQVIEFKPDNLMEARRNSRRHNMRNNVRKLPVAMVVSSRVQEEILRGPMQNVEENKRKTIVWKMEDAVQFLEEWHRENSPA